MAGTMETMYAVYGSVYRYLHNPRLTQPADLGTVIPFLLLGIFSFIFSAIIVPSSSGAIQNPLTTAAAPAEPEFVQKADEPAAPAAPAASPEPRGTRATSPQPSWQASAAILGLFAGWGWWAFALILCAVYEVKIIFGTIAMVAFGIIMTVAIVSELRPAQTSSRGHVRKADGVQVGEQQTPAGTAGTETK